MPVLVEIAVILALINAILKGGESWVDFVVLLILLLVNAGLGFYEEANANKAVEALQQQLAPTAVVLRDNEWKTVAARELVPGDVLSVKLGAVVAADCDVLEGSLDVDESALTGESLPATRHAGERIKSASIVRKGATTAVVRLTGARTYLGEAIALVGGGGGESPADAAVPAAKKAEEGRAITDADKRNSTTVTEEELGEHRSLGVTTAHRHVHFWQRWRRKKAAHAPPSSQMQAMLLQVTRVLIGLAVIGVLVLLLYLWIIKKQDFLTVMGLCMVLLIASIPVAIEVVSTAVMAVSARKLASRKVVVTRLVALEELASVDILCSDKTGTLTLNELTMGESWCPDAANVDERRALLYSLLTIEQVDPDPLDACVLKRLRTDEFKDVVDAASRYRIIEQIPFNPDTKRAECKAILIENKVSAKKFLKFTTQLIQ